MPLIDTGGLTLSPYIAGDQFSVIRRAEVVNDYGEFETASETIGPVYGSVFPTGDNSLVRREDFGAGAKTITVVTPFRLRMASKEAGIGYQPDVILWRGDHYIVRALKDWTAFGAGFVEAECSSIDFIDQAPQEPAG